MLTQEQNETLTRVGPGTPCGELMRRYWHPIYPEIQLRDNPVAKVRILCEDLVLYRDRSGKLGLIDERCPHRRMSLRLGIPEQDGIRCAYHGWLFDGTGRCLEQPLEPANSQLKDNIRIKSYPVQELGGLIWAYLGPDPAPVLPRWNLFTRTDGFRQIVAHNLPCNWLQVQENRADVGHATYLHGRLFQYVLERKGRLTDDGDARYNQVMKNQAAMTEQGAHYRYQVVPHQFGFAKGFKKSTSTVDEKLWNVGFNPVIFPYMLTAGPDERKRVRRTYQFGVPIDDTHTWHFQYFCYVFPDGVDVPQQTGVPYAEVPLFDANGDYQLDYVLGQDMVGWVEQGEICDRTKENLGATDVLMVAYRRLLREQIDIVRDGGEPMNVFRGDAAAQISELDIEGHAEEDTVDTGELKVVASRHFLHRPSKTGGLYIDDEADRFCPDRDTIVALMEQTEQIELAAQSDGERN